MDEIVIHLATRSYGKGIQRLLVDIFNKINEEVRNTRERVAGQEILQGKASGARLGPNQPEQDLQQEVQELHQNQNYPSLDDDSVGCNNRWPSWRASTSIPGPSLPSR